MGDSAIEIAIVRDSVRKEEREDVEDVKKLIVADPLGLTLTKEETVEPK